MPRHRAPRRTGRRRLADGGRHTRCRSLTGRRAEPRGVRAPRGSMPRERPTPCLATPNTGAATAPVVARRLVRRAVRDGSLPCRVEPRGIRALGRRRPSVSPGGDRRQEQGVLRRHLRQGRPAVRPQRACRWFAVRSRSFSLPPSSSPTRRPRSSRSRRSRPRCTLAALGNVRPATSGRTCQWRRERPPGVRVRPALPPGVP